MRFTQAESISDHLIIKLRLPPGEKRKRRTEISIKKFHQSTPLLHTAAAIRAPQAGSNDRESLLVVVGFKSVINTMQTPGVINFKIYFPHGAERKMSFQDYADEEESLWQPEQ